MRKIVLAATSIAALTLAISRPANAAPPFPLSVRQCSDRIETESAQLVTAVQNEIKASIKKNLNKQPSLCAGPNFVCGGGSNNNKTCSSNASCAGFECQPKATLGIAGAINKAKSHLRSQIAMCTPSDMMTLFGSDGSHRCPGPPAGLATSELANCIIRGASGQFSGTGLAGAVGEMMAYGAPDVAGDSPVPSKICGVTMGGLAVMGSASTSSNPIQPSNPLASLQPLVADGCVSGNPVCNTKVKGLLGNMVAAPTQVFAGTIPICLVSTGLDSGNGTPEDGVINLNTGEQHSLEPINETVIIGGTGCPICDKATLLCQGGPHNGLTCTNRGETDIACPPTVIGTPPVVVERRDLTTEPLTLAVPANNPGGGVTNLNDTFCGACAQDTTVGCSNDSDCVAKSICAGGLGSGCCQFGTNKGAFGDSTATSIQATGIRGPFLPHLASLFCLGKSGSGLVDGTVGLPGPIKSVELRLNAFEY